MDWIFRAGNCYWDLPGGGDVTNPLLDIEHTNVLLEEALRLIEAKQPGLSLTKIAMTLIAGTNANGRAATQQDLAGMTDFLSIVQDEKRFPILLREFCPSTSSRERRASVFDHARCEAWLNKKFFTTASGGYIGWGSKVMAEGDVVVILHGGHTPFILRPMTNSSEYKMIGECYVNGIMYGEAVVRHTALGGINIDFKIR